MQDKPKALTVASYLLKAVREDGREIGQTSLIKLTYIAHGLTLAVKNESLIGDEPVYAWKYGPVIKSIFYRYLGFKHYVIPDKFIDTSDEGTLNEDEKKVIQFTVKKYENYNYESLSVLTHKYGTPWNDVFEELQQYDQLGPNGELPKDVEIPNDLIADYYIYLVGDRGWNVLE